MNTVEQAKDDFSEVIFNILERMYSFLKKEEEKPSLEELLEKLSNRLEEKEQLNTDELKELNVLKSLQQNPELAKDLFKSIAIENIKVHSERFNEINIQALQEISKLKQSIDLNSPTGIDTLNSLNYLEKLQIDKQKEVNNIITAVTKEEMEISNKDATIEKKNKTENKEVELPEMLKELEQKGVDISKFSSKEEAIEKYHELNKENEKEVINEKEKEREIEREVSIRDLENENDYEIER